MSEENENGRKEESATNSTSGQSETIKADEAQERKPAAAAAGESAAPAAETTPETSPSATAPEAAAAPEAKPSKAAAAASPSAGSEPSDPPAAEAAAGPTDAEKEAKAKAAAEARAARAAARAQKTAEGDAGAEAAPKEPSPNQPRLDRIVQLIKENVSEDAVIEAVINERDRHLPMLTIQAERWFDVASFVRSNEELRLNYLRNLSGVDYESHLETVYYVLSLDTKHEYGFKVKTNRDEPSIPSVTPVWATANWNEREVYDLLGIDFPGHPDLRRIMLPDDWVGHPLRKDYEPIDPEV
ncbi:NADH-quinone oxidoreductase subunit C [Paenibacillus flagellatus]|uniref:NADH-quinone oxidoreductase subunit C n=1 Tax=Paenibacillus flagellatus TaxID=2211139 RepID=A0A2V5JWI2_9BACL|nr:NADH-quinone oxidoreductase subunit C [Paenibacillus flagellatus]PYI51139.1 NADH-quinone oxidoreductase subunit C [Paenibacillus flagellatus]